MNTNFNINFNGNFILQYIEHLKNTIKNRFYHVNIKNLTKNEVEIIKKFYNKNLNEYTLDSISLKENDITYPIILKLVKRNILVNHDIYSKIDNYDGNGVKYVLTSRAWKKLNRRMKYD